jgi:hypothetical protein
MRALRIHQDKRAAPRAVKIRSAKKVVTDFTRISQHPLRRAALSSRQTRSAAEEIEGATSAQVEDENAQPESSEHATRQAQRRGSHRPEMAGNARFRLVASVLFGKTNPPRTGGVTPCNAMQPGATWCNPMQPFCAIWKNEPTDEVNRPEVVIRPVVRYHSRPGSAHRVLRACCYPT